MSTIHRAYRGKKLDHRETSGRIYFFFFLLRKSFDNGNGMKWCRETFYRRAFVDGNYSSIAGGPIYFRESVGLQGVKVVSQTRRSSASVCTMRSQQLYARRQYVAIERELYDMIHAIETRSRLLRHIMHCEMHCARIIIRIIEIITSAARRVANDFILSILSFLLL